MCDKIIGSVQFSKLRMKVPSPTHYIGILAPLLLQGLLKIASVPTLTRALDPAPPVCLYTAY